MAAAYVQQVFTAAYEAVHREQIYEVEEVLAAARRGRHVWVQLKWAGEADEVTWEPFTALQEEALRARARELLAPSHPPQRRRVAPPSAEQLATARRREAEARQQRAHQKQLASQRRDQERDERNQRRRRHPPAAAAKVRLRPQTRSGASNVA